MAIINPRWLTLRETAEYLNVHMNTARMWVRSGRIKAFQICDRGDYRVSRKDLQDFVRQRPVKVRDLCRQ